MIVFYYDNGVGEEMCVVLCFEVFVSVVREGCDEGIDYRC